MNEKIRAFFAIPFALLVLIAFGATLVQGVTSGDYVGLTVTTPLMFALGGYVLGGYGVKIVRKEGDNGK